MYSLIFSKLYDNDVDSSYEYIKIRPLVRDEYLANLGYRLISVKNYLILYIIDDGNKHIKIIRFLYGKRDWINILKETPLDEIE